MRAFAIAALILFSAAAAAQGYPNKPIRLVVGYPPGGSGDFTTRLIADELSKDLGVAVIVENKAGAGGSIASEFVARSVADGYTLLNQGNHAINKSLYKDLAYDQKDFSPVCRVAIGTTILVVNLMPAADSKATEAMCGAEPKPAEAENNLPGFALA